MPYDPMPKSQDIVKLRVLQAPTVPIIFFYSLRT